MKDLLSVFPEELEELILSVGEPKYRAGQMFPQLHKGLSPEDMTNIGKKTREKLSEVAEYHLPQVRRKLVSALDGTVKYLFELRDGHCVESVVMRYNHGNTICISSQVGCRMGCRFCASTLDGLERNLSASEMLDQIYAIERTTGERVSNVVIMGTGEPFDNYDNVIKFMKIANEPKGLEIGARHISVSTCGLVPKIYDFAKEEMQSNLAISLHAPTNEVRNQIMPINKAYPIEELVEAIKYYIEKTNRRVTIEYILLKDLN